MRRCLNPMCLPELPLDEFVEVAGRWQYDAIEFPAQSALALEAAGALDGLRRRCHELGVAPYACSGAVALDDLRPADLTCEAQIYEAGKRNMRPRLAAARELGAELATVTMGPACPRGASEAARQEACERLGAVCDVARDCELNVVVEFTGVQHVEPPRLYDSIEAFAELIAAVDPRIEILLDTWHWFNSSCSRRDAVHLCARSVPLVHLSDAPRGVRPPLPDQARLLPGEGALDISSLLSLLPREAFAAIEVFDEGLRKLSPDAACRRLERAWGLISR